MRAGELRHLLTFQAKSAAQDELGEPINAWVDVLTCWGKVSPTTGRERMAAQAVQSYVSHSVTVRYASQLANPKDVAAMRIVFGTRIFDIHDSLNEDERNRMITLMAEEGLNNG
ncbi:phage head closure protein [Pandoraea communis]|uniref:phage head closure protein n=1 Tax=Pandoraea communis TaxID=2508297 RepID=UPI0025A532F8|nr:phage head closure protein [Pandoraea communis]MDM8356669.1 phage head closure protein [Pandoraea communis]